MKAVMVEVYVMRQETNWYLTEVQSISLRYITIRMRQKAWFGYGDLDDHPPVKSPYSFDAYTYLMDTDERGNGVLAYHGRSQPFDGGPCYIKRV